MNAVQPAACIRTQSMLKVNFSQPKVATMRSTFFVALVALSLLPATGFAQTAPQTAAVESAAPAPAAPTGNGGMTRDQFIERAKDRAAQRAGTRFDQMDTNHDGVLDRAEIRAQHARHAGAQPSQPAPQ
jgi:hypothetical protein